jgi:hypothetical protein
MANIGRMRERITAQRNDPPVLSVVSITRSSTTATVTTTLLHNYLSGDYVTIAGCDGATSSYNAKWKIVMVGSAAPWFTFTCSSAFPTPATGTMTVVYTSNAQGGQGANGSLWRTLSTDYGEYIPLKSWESLQLRALQSDTTGRFRVHADAKWNERLRLQWIPSWPAGATRKTLSITGLIRDPENLAYQILDVAEVAA